MDLPLRLDFALRFGDILTSVSVLLALSGFLYSWRKDRRLRTKEYADRVRAAASMTLAKIDRCESLYLSFIDRARPAFAEIHGLDAKSDADKSACWQEFLKQMTAVRNDTSLSQDDKRAKMMEVRKGSQDKIRAVLTDEQKTKYDALLAEMRDRMRERGQGGGGAPPAGPPQ